MYFYKVRSRRHGRVAATALFLRLQPKNMGRRYVHIRMIGMGLGRSSRRYGFSVRYFLNRVAVSRTEQLDLNEI
jgi:hypothetical protein